MEIRTEKVVTHTIDLSHNELVALARLLHQYKTDIGSKLPDGIDPKDDWLIREINAVAFTYGVGF